MPAGTGKIRERAEKAFCVDVWSAAVYWVLARTPVDPSPIGITRTRSARVLRSNVTAVVFEYVAVKPAVVVVPFFREYVIVVVNVGVNVVVSGFASGGTRFAAGTGKIGSAGELFETVALTAGAAAKDWNGAIPVNVCSVLFTVRVAAVIFSDCVLVTVHAVGLVRKNLASVSLPRTSRA